VSFCGSIWCMDTYIYIYIDKQGWEWVLRVCVQVPFAVSFVVLFGF